MDRTASRLMFLHRPKNIFLLVAAGLLLLHILLFRDVLFASGDIMQNKASVVRDELVPFFSFSNGYMPSATSELTGSDEFRVTYSFWTSWVRYNPILPAMLVLVNTLAAYLLFYAFYRVLRHFTANPLKAVFVALLAALLIHFVLMYAKIAHFYTLILGFGMFALALSMVIEQLFFEAKVKIKPLLVVSLLVLINPAIHYHLIFYLGAGLIFILHTVTALITRSFSGAQCKRAVLYLLAVLALSLIPYLAYIYLTTPASDDVFKQIPVNYWMIFYSSVPILYLLSFDSLGHVDLFRYGDYRAPEATASMLIVFALIASLFLLRQWRQQAIAKRNLVYILFVLTLLSVWMAVGYSGKTLISFHDTLGAVSGFLSGMDNIVAQTLEQFVNIFINILRFPHRFQFLFYYSAGILLGFVLLWLFGFLRSKRLGIKTACIALALLVATPLLGSPAYRETFLTGDFGGFLAPYKVPAELATIKETLGGQAGNRLFILPSLESGRVISANGERYSFLDKYLIYYLEQPAVYTGYGADTTNKIMSHMVYRSILDGSPWWQDILVNGLGVTHVLVPKHTEERSAQTIYLPGIESKITTALQNSTSFRPALDGQDFALYEIRNRSQPTANLLTDLPWSVFTKHFSQDQARTERLFFPIQGAAYQQAKGEHYALTDNPERLFYHLYTAKNGSSVPDTNLLPFTTDLVPSSNFTANMFSLSTLYNSQDDYNYTKETVPSLLNVQTAQFVGINANSDAEIATDMTAQEAGEYRLLLHAASQHDTITVKLNGQAIKLRRLAGDPLTKDYLDFTYYTADVRLKAGKNSAVIASGNKTTLIESIAHIKVAVIPANFTEINQDGLAITPTDEPDTYKVTFGQ